VQPILDKLVEIGCVISREKTDKSGTYTEYLLRNNPGAPPRKEKDKPAAWKWPWLEPALQPSLVPVPTNRSFPSPGANGFQLPFSLTFLLYVVLYCSVYVFLIFQSFHPEPINVMKHHTTDPIRRAHHVAWNAAQEVRRRTHNPEAAHKTFKRLFPQVLMEFCGLTPELPTDTPQHWPMTR
jgi:hypothetical protein